MEEKQFNLWNEEKQHIELTDTKHIICKRRQFWLCKIWENIGSEISKNNPFIRPILIINERLRWWLIVAVPLSTKFKEHSAKSYYCINESSKYWLNAKSYCILDQIRVVSRKRLVRKLNDFETFDNMEVPLLDKEQFLEIIKRIHLFI